MHPLPPIKRTGKFASKASARRMRVGSEMYWAVVAPGATMLRRMWVLGVLLLALGIGAPIALVVWIVMERDELVDLALDDRFLRTVALTLAVALFARVVAVIELTIVRWHDRNVGLAAIMAYVMVALLAVPIGWSVVRAEQARELVDDVFAGSDDAPPLFVPSDETIVVEEAAAVEDAAPSGTTNILLLGGDSAPGRWGLRTDTMILVSADRASGRTSLVSIPRDLRELQFPPGSPLHERFPDGFDNIANAVYPYVLTKPELQEQYAQDGLQPEAVAVSEAIGYSLGVRIDDYVLVNMQGFLELIDAVGGVTVDLERSVPLPPALPGAKHDIPSSVGPGPVEMDGTLALAFARSRYADSDYGRMGRQRQLLAALGEQISLADAVGGFSSVAGALSDAVRTSLSPDAFTDLLDTLGDTASITESVGLVPPLIVPGNPDYDQIRQIVADVQDAIATGVPSQYAQA
ncbi:MAG TPA: LCP family protein [Ilumatobacteraceae bacterium]|nr:LCP family protein [Ilumatobacteraceae bacterium]